MNANITKTVLGSLLPFITNPATLAIIGIGAVGLTLYEILTEKKGGQGNGSEPQNNGSELLIEPIADGSAAAAATVPKPMKITIPTVATTPLSTVEVPLETDIANDGGYSTEQDDTVGPDFSKKELIRQAMSELGKRSAAARANKRAIN